MNPVIALPRAIEVIGYLKASYGMRLRIQRRWMSSTWINCVPRTVAKEVDLQAAFANEMKWGNRDKHDQACINTADYLIVVDIPATDQLI